MALVCITGLPSFSSVNVFSRVCQSRSATMSIACSRSRDSHSRECGRRYFTFISRVGLVTSSKLSAPFGHKCPREIGDSGSPSMLMSLPSLWNASCPQPTPQYGQTDRATFAPSNFGFSLRVRLVIASGPVPSAPVLICCSRGQLESRSLSMKSPPE